MTVSATPARDDIDATPTRTITAGHLGRNALDDVLAGFAMFPTWSRLAAHDIRQRFARSVLGPLWLTLSMGIMVGAMSLVFGTLLGQNIQQTLPHIATGLIFWGLLTSCINDGTNVFISSEAYIRNVPLPLSFHVLRMLARNVLIWAFNMAIYLVIVVLFRPNLGWGVLLFVPGFALFIVNLSWIALVAAILSTRYRDIPQVIVNVVQVVFFLTPIFWTVESLPQRPAFVTFNPFYHLIEIVRGPLLGTAPGPLSWFAATGTAIVGLALAAVLYRRAFPRISYWV